MSGNLLEKGESAMHSPAASAASAAVGVRRRLKLLLLFMIFFMSWAAYKLFVQYGQVSDRQDQLRAADKKLTEAVAKSGKLQQEIDRLNDPEYIGQIARMQGMGYEGEKPIHVEDGKK